MFTNTTTVRKTLALALVLAIVVAALAGCGGSDSSNSQSPGGDRQTSSPTVPTNTPPSVSTDTAPPDTDGDETPTQGDSEPPAGAGTREDPAGWGEWVTVNDWPTVYRVPVDEFKIEYYDATLRWRVTDVLLGDDAVAFVENYARDTGHDDLLGWENPWVVVFCEYSMNLDSVPEAVREDVDVGRLSNWLRVTNARGGLDLAPSTMRMIFAGDAIPVSDEPSFDEVKPDAEVWSISLAFSLGGDDISHLGPTLFALENLRGGESTSTYVRGWNWEDVDDDD
jgi:hypothetical protein